MRRHVKSDARRTASESEKLADGSFGDVIVIASQLGPLQPLNSPFLFSNRSMMKEEDPMR
jgi:hypothetical protein